MNTTDILLFLDIEYDKCPLYKRVTFDLKEYKIINGKALVPVGNMNDRISLSKRYLTTHFILCIDMIKKAIIEWYPANICWGIC